MVITDIEISSEHIQWIKKYISNSSPSGNEIQGQRMWLDYIKPYIDTHVIDNYGNVIGVINEGAKFKVLIFVFLFIELNSIEAP